MADTAVAITAGAGTNIDTRTESTNSNHRQVVVLGDPSTNAGVAAVDVNNGLSVNVTNATLTVASHQVTNAGTFAVQAANLENTQGAATAGIKGPLVMGSVTTAAPSYTTAQTSPLSLDTSGALRVNIAADSVGSTVDTEDGTVATGQSNVALVIGQPYEYDGTNWTRPRGGHTVAHDAVDAGNPDKLGAHAKSALSGLTLVSSDDRTDLFADLDGVLLSRPASLGDVVQERTTNTDGASTAFASGLAAPGAGVRLWVTQVTVCNSSATFCTVDLRDGSAGSVLWTLPVPATGGVVQQFNPPLKLTAATALAFDASGATTTLTISANAFKSKL